MELFNDLILLLDATIRVATPLIFAALAGLYSERSGVFDIGLEGKMLISAFAAAAVAAISSSVLIGLVAGMLAGVLFALIHGFACITHRGNQIVSGVAINMLAVGLTTSLGHAWFQRGGQTPSLENPETYEGIDLPLVPPSDAEIAEGLEAAGLDLNPNDDEYLIDAIEDLPPEVIENAESVSSLVDTIIASDPDLGNRQIGRLERAAEEADQSAGGIDAITEVLTEASAEPVPVLSWGMGGIEDFLNGFVSILQAERFFSIQLPFAETVADVPILGGIYSELLSGHSILVYVALLAVPFTAWVVYRTRFGLRLRAVGENPAAVDTAGISVTWLRYRAVIITGILCGLAGAYLSTSQGASFGREMTAGQGFIALAALIFAKWRPWPVLFTCLLFGFFGAMEARLQGFEVPMIGEIPVQFIQALPYILTVVVLAGFIGKAVAPKAGGIPYVKER